MLIRREADKNGAPIVFKYLDHHTDGRFSAECILMLQVCKSCLLGLGKNREVWKVIRGIRLVPIEHADTYKFLDNDHALRACTNIKQLAWTFGDWRLGPYPFRKNWFWKYNVFVNIIFILLACCTNIWLRSYEFWGSVLFGSEKDRNHAAAKRHCPLSWFSPKSNRNVWHRDKNLNRRISQRKSRQADEKAEGGYW